MSYKSQINGKTIKDIYVVTSGGLRKAKDMYSVTSNGLRKWVHDGGVTPAICTWADGTWAEIADALAAHKAGEINLYNTSGWEIGSIRQVELSAMEATGVGESHVVQTVEIVLSDKNVYDLTDGSGKCIFTWDLVDLLANGTTGELGYMNSTNTNSGGWDGCARRTWCNSVFYNALPAEFKALIPQVKVKASAGGHSSTINTSNDYCFLRAEIELFGHTRLSSSGEGNQIDYYKTSANRVKKRGKNGVAYDWWLRSPRSSYSSYFCVVTASNTPSWSNAGTNRGISPAGCI